VAFEVLRRAPAARALLASPKTALEAGMVRAVSFRRDWAISVCETLAWGNGLDK